MLRFSPRNVLLFGFCAGLLLFSSPERSGAQGQTCQEVTIAEIQGSDEASPFDRRSRGLCAIACVTGVAAEGFFVQSLAPDDDPSSSEGVYVYRYSSWMNPRGLKTGDKIRIKNFAVQEFYGQTEIVKLANDKRDSYEVVGRCPLPDPVRISVSLDVSISPSEAYERFEGMRVSLSVDGSVVGPTQRYPSRFPAGDPEITLANTGSPFHGRRALETEVPVEPSFLVLAGGLGVDLPDVGTLDRLRADLVTGILAYQFGRYVLLVEGHPSFIVEDAPDPRDSELPLSGAEFGVCTFNAENLFDHLEDGDGDVGDWSPTSAAVYRAAIEARAAVIREDLARCSIVGLQEVEGKDAVWQALATAVGPDYRYDYWESQDARDITVGLLYDGRRVDLRGSEPAQACTPKDYGVSYATEVGPRAPGRRCPAGQFPLYDRPPYVADLTVRDREGVRALDLRVIVSHLKSKSGDESENEPRRVLQAAHVASLMAAAPLSAALGDLNDTLGSRALQQFAGARNLYERHVAPEDRYSYIYQGWAEAIDYIIMSPELERYLLRGGPVHINSDFPERLVSDELRGRTSDHDPLSARFAFHPTGVTEAFQDALIGALLFP